MMQPIFSKDDCQDIIDMCDVVLRAKGLQALDMVNNMLAKVRQYIDQLDQAGPANVSGRPEA